MKERTNSTKKTRTDTQNKIIIFNQLGRISIYRKLQINLQALLKMD